MNRLDGQMQLRYDTRVLAMLAQYYSRESARAREGTGARSAFAWRFAPSKNELVRAALEDLIDLLIKAGMIEPIISMSEAEAVLEECGMSAAKRSGSAASSYRKELLEERGAPAYRNDKLAQQGKRMRKQAQKEEIIETRSEADEGEWSGETDELRHNTPGSNK